MNEYSDAHPPRHGNARRIYVALKAAGYSIRDLHYNARNWGRAPEEGWGTWACEITSQTHDFTGWCGCDEIGVFLCCSSAPYNTIYLTPGR